MVRIFQAVFLACLLTVFSTIALAVSPTYFTIVKDPINFSDYKGKWVVINYWATWCNACMEEVPSLNAFYRAHRNQVVMFGVNYEDGPLKNLPQRIQESGVAFPTFAYDPKGRFGVGRIRGLPTTLLIGPDGRLKRMLVGSQTKQDLEQALGLE
ncbi:MAG: TlpA disulfide reductase family protein [Rickettsiella sp.]|nr:TlpA disulfide reductase family protein [Rickettsiella sp.]